MEEKNQKEQKAWKNKSMQDKVNANKKRIEEQRPGNLDILRKYKERYGLSEKDFANALGVNYPKFRWWMLTDDMQLSTFLDLLHRMHIDAKPTIIDHEPGKKKKQVKQEEEQQQNSSITFTGEGVEPFLDIKNNNSTHKGTQKNVLKTWLNEHPNGNLAFLAEWILTKADSLKEFCDDINYEKEEEKLGVNIPRYTGMYNWFKDDDIKLSNLATLTKIFNITLNYQLSKYEVNQNKDNK